MSEEKAKKYDDGKLRPGLIPPEVTAALAKRFMIGTKKYGDGNWNKGNGFAYSRLIDALERHLMKFKAGQDIDQEDGGLHIEGVLWSACILVMQLARGTGTDDRGLIYGECSLSYLSPDKAPENATQVPLTPKIEPPAPAVSFMRSELCDYCIHDYDLENGEFPEICIGCNTPDGGDLKFEAKADNGVYWLNGISYKDCKSCKHNGVFKIGKWPEGCIKCNDPNETKNNYERKEKIHIEYKREEIPPLPQAPIIDLYHDHYCRKCKYGRSDETTPPQRLEACALCRIGSRFCPRKNFSIHCCSNCAYHNKTDKIGNCMECQNNSNFKLKDYVKEYWDAKEGRK